MLDENVPEGLKISTEGNPKGVQHEDRSYPRGEQVSYDHEAISMVSRRVVFGMQRFNQGFIHKKKSLKYSQLLSFINLFTLIRNT